MSAQSYIAYADSIPDYGHYVFVGYDGGIVARTNDFVKGLNAEGKNIRNYKSLMAGFGWQANGTKDWHHKYNFPSFGLGVYTVKYDYNEEVGQPISLYGFYRGSWLRRKGHNWGYNLEVGMAMGWKSYDYETNPYNIAVGSYCTVHLGLSFQYTYTIAKRWQVGVGAGLTHFSNGAIKKPNRGFNMMSYQARIAYLLEDERIPHVRRDVARQKGNEVDVISGIGIKESDINSRRRPEMQGKENIFHDKYIVNTISVQYLHRYSQKGKYGIGFSCVYDEWLGSDFLINNDDDIYIVMGPMRDRLSCGVYAAHELCVNNLAFYTQFGCYFHDPSLKEKSTYKDIFFQRAGVKYTFPINLMVGVGIYAHRLSKADFIEWSLGYALDIRKKKSE